MDGWDPMRTAYEDSKFNSYSQGVGRDLVDSNATSSGAKLFVHNVPTKIGNEGLYNLFAEYGTVVDATLKHSDRTTTFGFVTMRTPVEGAAAISKLDNYKVGGVVIRVSVALSQGEKDRRRQAQQREASILGSFRQDFDWDDTASVHSVHSNRDAHAVPYRNFQPMGGRGRGAYQPRGPLLHPMAPLFPPRPAMMHPRQPLLSQWGPGPMYQSQGYPLQPLGFGRGFNASDRSMDCKKPEITVPENERLKDMKCCLYCRKDGCVDVCTRCRMYYCSVGCQKKDWPQHKELCLAFGEYYKKTGTLKTQIGRDTPEKNKSSEGESEATQPHRQNKTNRNNKGDNKNSRNQTGAGRKQGDFEAKNNLPGNRAGGVTKPLTKELKGNDSKASLPQTDVRKEPESCVTGNGATSPGPKSMPSDDVSGPVGGAGDASYGQVQMSIPVGSSGLAYMTYYENPYKFWISLVDHLEEFAETTQLILKQESLSPPANPKPRETYGVMWEGEWARVEVLSAAEDNITVFFMDYGNTAVVKTKDLRPLTLDIIKLPAQAICCCVSKMNPPGGCWSDAAVAAVAEWFGPPMSQYFSFDVVEKKGSKHAVKISIDNEAMSEFLLSKNFAERDAGQPGLSSLPGNKDGRLSRFTVKDLKSEMGTVNVGDQLTTALDFQSLHRFVALKQTSLATLLELDEMMATEYSGSQPSYRPEVGEIVAAIFSADSKWYRSQVLKVEGDKCSLFFVDYGNMEDQVVQNVRQIRNERIKDTPAQALVCCLHGIDNLITSLTEEEQTKHFNELLPGYQVDEAWTLLSIKGKKENQLLVDIVSSKGQSLTDQFKKKIAPAVKSPVSLVMSGADNPMMSSPVSPNSLKSVFEPKRAATPCVDLKEETLAVDPDRKVSLTVSHVENCGEFYVRVAAKGESFKALSKELNSSVQQLPAVVSQPAVGSLVAVQFSVDKVFYRGKVVQVEPGSNASRCKILFVDFGNVEMVRWQELKELSRSMCQFPAQAVKCHLQGNLKGLPAASHQEFKHYLENETVDALVVAAEQGSMALQIFAHGQCINTVLFGDGEPQKPEPKPSNKKKIADPILPIGTPVKVECVTMASRAAFFVQISAQAETAMMITLSLKTRLDQSPDPVKSVNAGDFVASRFSQDEEVIWYRGRVDKVEGDKATIFFVDFGNFEERSVSELMELSDEDCAVPASTVRCCLKTSALTSPAMEEKFSREGQAQIDSIQVLSQESDGCTVDVLDREGNIITDMFTPMQKSPMSAKPSTIPSTSSSPKTSLMPQAVSSPPSTKETSLPTQSISDRKAPVSVTVTQVDSCSSLYVQLVDDALQMLLLQVMMALNEQAESLPCLKQPQPGSLCAACFSQDGSWYRARVLSLVSATTCIVQFVDYGNAEETISSNLRCLDDSAFTELPAQAIQCCLKGFEDGMAATPAGSGDKSLVEKLKAAVLERAVNLKVVSQIKNTPVVDMEDEHGQSLSEKFAVMAKPAGKVPKQTDLIFEKPAEKEFDALFLQLTNLDEFYCHRINQEEIDELMCMGELLQGDVEKLPAGVTCQPVVGGLYTSQFQGVWYRCVVEKIVTPNVSIRYIDFGNTEEKLASELRPLNEKRLAIPVRSVRCRLYGVKPTQPNWKHQEMPAYLNLLNEKQPRLQVHGEGEAGELLVSILIDGGSDTINVAQDLISIGMATASSGSQGGAEACVAEKDDDDDGEEEDPDELAKQIAELQMRLNKKKAKTGLKK